MLLTVDMIMPPPLVQPYGTTELHILLPLL